MDYANEAKLKQMATEQQTARAYDNTKCNVGSGSLGGAMCMDQDKIPCRDPLIERVRSRFHRSASEGRKADRMNELLFLLEKNPEVARILDLVGEVEY